MLAHLIGCGRRMRRMGRPNTALVISESEKTALQAIVRARSMPHSLVRRAKIVLLSADGASNRAVATQCGVSAPVVSLWRSRYQARRARRTARRAASGATAQLW